MFCNVIHHRYLFHWDLDPLEDPCFLDPWRSLNPLRPLSTCILEFLEPLEVLEPLEALEHLFSLRSLGLLYLLEVLEPLEALEHLYLLEVLELLYHLEVLEPLEALEHLYLLEVLEPCISLRPLRTCRSLRPSGSLPVLLVPCFPLINVVAPVPNRPIIYYTRYIYPNVFSNE